jgi:membrane fusion protein (multidrug efflux system)
VQPDFLKIGTLMKHLPKTSAIAIGALLLCSAAYAGSRLLSTPQLQSTNDAFVAADVTVLMPKVGGIVTAVLVGDNQAVRTGDLLLRIDDRDYQAALAAAQAGVANAQANIDNAAATLERQRFLIAQAEATVSADQADLVLARSELERYTRLASQGAGTAQNAQQAQAKHDAMQARLAQDRAAMGAAGQQRSVLQTQLTVAQAQLRRAEAAQQQAELDLSHTEVRAPQDGVIARRSARVGAHVGPATALMAVVPLQQAYVVANFMETQLARVQPGQVVRVTVDGWPDVVVTGHVDSIAPATGATFSAVAPDNATGNFTKVVQRIPTRIALDANPAWRGKLRVGMSVTASIDTASIAAAPAGNTPVAMAVTR